MKRVRGLLTLVLTMLVMLQLSTPVLAASEIPSATSNFYVNDFAEIFTTEEETRLMNKAVSLSDNYDGIQVVVTTIKSLNGDTIEDYALRMYNQYGIGKNDMGVLILLSTGERQIRVEVGRSMEAYVNDAKVGRFIDKYAIPYLKENKFNEGLINLQESLIDEIVDKVKNETQTSKEITSKKQSTSNVDPLTVLFWILAIVLSCGLVFLISYVIKKQKRKKAELKNLKDELNQVNKLRKQEQKEYEFLLNELKEAELEKRNELRDSLTREKDNIIAEHKKEIFSLETKLTEEQAISEDLRKVSQLLNNEMSVIKDRYARITTLYPTADEEVDKMIEEEERQKDMAAAQEVDEAISKVLALQADKDNVLEFQAVTLAYSELTESQKAYSTQDITLVQKLYEESVALKEEYEEQVRQENNKKEAENVSKSITAILAAITVGKAANLEKLKEAEKSYEGLSSGALDYFDEALIQKTRKLLKEAEIDFENEQRIKKLKAAAKDAEKRINSKISYCYGKASELSTLEDARRIYERLDSDEKKYFDDSVLRKLENLIDEAERDKRRKEEEERRRRYDDDDFLSGGSSNFGGHSGFGGGFGGLGGRSGGGGASRGF